MVIVGWVMRVATPNDPKLSDGGVRRGTCMVGGKAAAEAGAVTHGAVRCSAWLGRANSQSKCNTEYLEDGRGRESRFGGNCVRRLRMNYRQLNGEEDRKSVV